MLWFSCLIGFGLRTFCTKFAAVAMLLQCGFTGGPILPAVPTVDPRMLRGLRWTAKDVSPFMVGQTFGHYRIESKLGEGGMGAVWKARDTRLDRFVALKTLPAERLADQERRRRFVQEAKSASALNHPNIVHIYDIADADAVPFIAMEYVAGKTLDQLIGANLIRYY